MKRRSPFDPLDAEERELIDSVERGEWREAGDVRRLKEQALEYAEATIRKDKRMNIRISERDLRNLKRRALEEGIPYQTMVSMVLHKYVSGQYVERPPLSEEGENRSGRRGRGRSNKSVELSRAGVRK
jgi:predicted DNA binding CopG/RHH family protein